MLVPLRRAQVIHGVNVRMVPFAELPGEVRPGTRLVACSHVSWVGGEVMDVAALRATGVPILLDAAQALGAIPVDVHELGVDFYAGSGQKWMCGPEGSGALYVRGDRLDELEPPFPGYASVADHDEPFGSALADTAARLDDGFPSALRSTWALASMSVLAGAGWAWVHERAATGAERLAELLRERGHRVAPRGRSTLVAWAAADADGEVARLLAESYHRAQHPVRRVGARLGGRLDLRGGDSTTVRAGLNARQFGAPALHEFGCRSLPGHPVGLTGPQVDRLRIAGHSCRGAQGGGEVVHVGVGRRGPRPMLDHEGVDDPTGAATTEGSRQTGRARLTERRAVRCARARLGTEHEGGPDLGSDRASAERGCHPGPVGDPAGRDQREAGDGTHQPQQAEQSELSTAVHILEGAAVTTGLDALADQGVRARVGGEHRLLRLGDGHPDGDARPPERAHEFRRRAAEGERDDRRLELSHDLELGLQSVIVEARRAERRAIPCGDRLELAGVGVEGDFDLSGTRRPGTGSRQDRRRSVPGRP